jgi:squalene-hopene/tetraprenyl-beta-curcumene cyclase
LHLEGTLHCASRLSCIDRANHWIAKHVGSLDPEAIANAVIARYGKDKTFSVPILMLCSICGTLGEEGWRRVLPLPFELAAFPRTWFGAIGLPVVSYALPALIAIGYTRFFHAPPAKWNPLRWLRAALWPRISPMLKTLQPSSGGYLEATPLTSFVTMALASADEKHHPCVPVAVGFLLRSQREDGSWAIDTNLATWGTTLSTKALSWSAGFSLSERNPIRTWLLSQQYREVHPFTNAAPGGWAWTDLPGGVPDADDTSGALIALWHLCESDDERRQILPAVEEGLHWLVELQNRDGGMPTFCRGWGTLPFDRSTPEITAHALTAWMMWRRFLLGSWPPRDTHVGRACEKAFAYLQQTFAAGAKKEDASLGSASWAEAARRRWSEQGRVDVGWTPLWFGNEHAPDESNIVFGTAQVLNHVLAREEPSAFGHDPMVSGPLRGMCFRSSVINSLERHLFAAMEVLLFCQNDDGSWGGGIKSASSIEETALSLEALSHLVGCAPWPEWTDEEHSRPRAVSAIQRGVTWLLDATRDGAHFPAAPIGLYFARLWYHEKMYPVIWTLAALQVASAALTPPTPDPS